ncbi:hypothetical protein V6N13_098331 [Hibiscus sabdariffa]
MQSYGLEKLSMVISTSHWERIETVIDVEVGLDLFPVRISEVPSPEEKQVPHQVLIKVKAGHKQVLSTKSSSSSCTGEHSVQVESTGDKNVGVREDINSEGMGNTNFTQNNEADLDLNRQIGIQELQGPLSQVNCQLGVGKFTRWTDVVANNVVGPEGQAGKDLTQSQIQIEDRVSDTENLNVFQTSIGPLADQDQADRVLDREVGRTSPMGSVSWAEAVDLANIAPFLGALEKGNTLQVWIVSTRMGA